MPSKGASESAAISTPNGAEAMAVYSFGGQFAEVRVDSRMHDVRVPPLVGAFAAGRIVNERTSLPDFSTGIWPTMQPS